MLATWIWIFLYEYINPILFWSWLLPLQSSYLLMCCLAEHLGQYWQSCLPSCEHIIMTDIPPSLFTPSFIITSWKCWKCNLRNVVTVCWDVMMVGDRQPVVSLVFTSSPPSFKQKILDESGLCCSLTVPLLFCIVGSTIAIDSKWLGGGTIIRPACIFLSVTLRMSLFVLISLSLCLSVWFVFP